MTQNLGILVIADDEELAASLESGLSHYKISEKIHKIGSKEMEGMDQWHGYFLIVLLDVFDIDCYTRLEDINLPKLMVITDACFKHNKQSLVQVLRLTSFPVYYNVQDPKLAEFIESIIKNPLITVNTSNRMNKNLIQSTLGALGDGVIVTNFDGEIQFMNQIARSITRYFGPISEISFGDLFSIVNHHELYSDSYIFDKMKLLNTQFGLQSDTKLIDQEGNSKYISATLSPLDVKKQGLIGLAVVFRDINRIRESEKRLHLYSETIKQSMEALVITNKDFVVESANAKFFQAFGLNKEEVLGSDIFKIQPFVDRLSRKIIDEEVLEYKVFRQIIHTNIHKQKGHYRIIVSPVIEGVDVYYLISFVDMTKQIQVERTLEKERKNLNTIFEGLPLGVVIMNEDLSITKVNREVVELFNLNDSDLIGKHFGDAIGCDHDSDYCSDNGSCDNCIMKEYIDKAFRDQVVIRGEEVSFKSLDSSGNEQSRWFRMSAVPFEMGEVNQVMSVFEDVTSQKKIADSLFKNEHKLRLITDNMIDTITQVDTSGKVLYASPSHWNLLGYTPEYLVGKNLFEFIHPEDITLATGRLEERVKTKKSFSSEIRLRRKDGQYIWLESVGNVLEDIDGRITLIYVSRDVSVKREVLQQMQKSKDAAEGANKAKSEFLANMSHEIRTPMNGIIGMTNLTLMSDITDDQRENLNMVRTSAENLLKIINSILDFSKIESGKIVVELHPFNLKHILEKTVSPFKAEALSKEVSIVYELDPSIASVVKGDSNRLIQVFNNLIGNALKFTHKGYVRLKVTKVATRHGSAIVRFEVTDTGIGIAREHHEKLFDSFSQVDGSMTRKYGGTGLGLTITKQLVELMGGQISLESEVGKGSVFYFDIPLQEVEVHVSSEKDKIMSVPDAKRGLKVLLAEDDMINQTLAIRLLEKQNHEVVVANNGLEAVEAIKDQDFDIVLMDISMPVMNGLEATRYIRESLGKKSLPIVALTAHAIKGDQELFMNGGMNAYIAKPIDLQVFYQTIDLLTSKDEMVKDLINRANGQIENDVTKEELKEFQQELMIYTQKIAIAIKKRNFHDIEELAHYIKTLATTVGDRQVKTWALKIELEARKENLDKLVITFEGLMDVVERLERGLS